MADENAGSARERKRQETLRRIAEAGVKLFHAHGYEATTLDAIAAEAGISRRTFFHYFKSKDDILLSLQAGLGEQIVGALSNEPVGITPIAALRRAMFAIMAPYSPEELLKLDRMMRSSEAVQARKQASYIREEQVVFAGLQQLWPGEGETALRLVASMAISIVRLSLDAWSKDPEVKPLKALVTEAFEALETLKA